MKKVKISCIIAGLLLCSFGKTSAQIERLDRKSTEVLVFIMPDSLELAPELKRGASVRQSTIKSQRLKTALEAAGVKSISKAFPDRQEADSIAYTESGERVKKPEFHRIFTLSFASEQEADEAIKKLNGLPAVLYAEKNSSPELYNDPQYIDGTQWHLENDGRNGGVVDADIDAEEAWSIFTGSSNITIGIFDTGVEISHDDLTGKATGDLPIGDGHGTQVAGVAAATANNGEGGRGVDWNARIRSYRVVYDPNVGDAELSAAIMDAVNSGVHVLNHSWGSPTYSSTIAQAFAYAYKMNRVSVAAMGNSGIAQTNYPAAFSNIIAVGATTNADVRSGFSTTGSHIDVVAPGGLNGDTTNSANVHVPYLNNTYIFNGGTSFAAPQVSGLASLLKGYNSNLSNDDIEQIIELSADKVGPAGTNYNGGPRGGHNDQYGYGRINAGRALAMVRDNQLYHFTATGGMVISSTGNFVMTVIGAPGVASAAYVVRRYEVMKTAHFPESFLQIAGAWGRGVGTTGWSMANPNFGEGFCEDLSYTSTFVTLRTYVYEMFDMAGRQLGYYPASPANVTFAYTVLGKPAPTITGPAEVCYSGSTFTLSYTPASTITWSVTGPFTVSSNGATATVTRTAGTSNSSGTLTASMNGGVIASKVITPCPAPTIDGYTEICPSGCFTLLNPPPGTIYWTLSYTGDFIVSSSGNPTWVTYVGTGSPLNTLHARIGSASGPVVASTVVVPCTLHLAPPLIAVYPNPTSDILNIEIDGEAITNAQNSKQSGASVKRISIESAFDIRLYDGQGNLLRHATAKEGNVQFNVANLPNGIYYLHFYKETGNKPEIQQIVVEH